MSSPVLSLSPSEIQLIRSCFAQVQRTPERAAACFYENLFTLEPRTRGLFHGDMRTQGQKLVATLSLLVSQLDHLAPLLPALRELGRRHVHYRVEASHYPLVGQALLQMLAQTCAESWNRECEEAWGRLYGYVAGVMIAAAEELVLAPAPGAPGASE